MFTFIFWIVLSCFHSTRGLIELHKDLIAAAEVFGSISSQTVSSVNDTKFQEFADIFNRYVNLTEREKEYRELLSKLTTVNSTDDNDNQDLEWHNAINDALAEENITIGFQLNNDDFLTHIQNITSTPENLKELQLQRLDSERNQSNYKGYNDLYGVNPDAESETTAAVESHFWDADDAPTRRIYRGQRAKIKQYPFIVSVIILSSFACAGSIIKDDLVITAASCLQLAHNNRFFRENPILIEVRVGSQYFVLGGEVIPVTEVYFYPSYDPPTLRNNLAIMRLRRVLSFKRRNVKKIDFDRAPSALAENTPPIMIIGWGAASVSNKLYFKETLRVSNLDFYDHHSCKEIYGRKFVNRENFCAGFISRGEGACNHDVGDPGVSGRYLVGVTSFGSPVCGRPDTPTVFTKVGFYADWIQGIIDQDVPRMHFSTSTARPYAIHDKSIILYGLADGENAPISFAREGVKTNSAQDTAAVDADLQIVLNKLKKLGIENAPSENMLPSEEQDPEIKYDGPFPEGPLVHQFIETDRSADEENGNALRVEDQNKEEELNNKLPDKGDLGGSDSGDSTPNPVDRATKIDDLDMNLSESKEMQKTDVENDSRVTKLPEEIISAENSESDYVNMAETKSTKKGIKRERDVHKSNSNKKHAQNYVKTLTKRQRKPTTTNYQFMDMPKHAAQEFIQKEYDMKIMPPDILGNIRPFDLGYDDKKVSAKYHKETRYEDKTQKQIPKKKKGSKDLVNILKEHHESNSIKEEIRDHDQDHDKLANRLADDIVKSEIQKLIDQLDVSSDEVNSNTEDSEFPYKSPMRNDETDKADEAKTILTFLYLTGRDSENRNQDGAKLSSNEGLSIDPVPFERRMVKHRGNDLVGKSDIYEIFANVMNTVVNKTFV